MLRTILISWRIWEKERTKCYQWLNQGLWGCENHHWLLTHPREWSEVGTPLNRNMFSFVTPEQPKKLALMPVKLLNQILKTTEEGKQSLRKKYWKVCPELRKGNIANRSNFQMFKSTTFSKSTVYTKVLVYTKCSSSVW